jgi:hypothetical protein
MKSEPVAEGRCLSTDPFAIPASNVLAYGKYAPRDSPPASLDLDRNTPAFFSHPRSTDLRELQSESMQYHALGFAMSAEVPRQ